jgi:hypothetical protein
MSKTKADRSDRDGTRAIVAHVDESIYRDFKVLAAKNLSTTSDMVHEAVGLLFDKYKERQPPALQRKLATLDS